MPNLNELAVIIPCYRSGSLINHVIKDLKLHKIHKIIVVDDCCPLNSSKYIKDDVIILKNKENLGVGGAFSTGFNYIKKNNLDFKFVAKIDADNQHNASDLLLMLNDILEFDSDLVKGNRYLLKRKSYNQSFIRKLGNSGLSFFIKLATGYWNINDPVNGQFIIRSNVYDYLHRNMKIKSRYLFEVSLINLCSTIGAKISETPNNIVYSNEISSLSIFRSFFSFFWYLSSCTIKRIVYEYFYPNFNIGSIFIICFLFFLPYGLFNGIISIKSSYQSGIPTEVGLISIILISILIGVISLFNFFIIDQKNNDINKKSIHKYFKDKK